MMELSTRSDANKSEELLQSKAQFAAELMRRKGIIDVEFIHHDEPFTIGLNTRYEPDQIGGLLSYSKLKISTDITRLKFFNHSVYCLQEPYRDGWSIAYELDCLEKNSFEYTIQVCLFDTISNRPVILSEAKQRRLSKLPYQLTRQPGGFTIVTEVLNRELSQFTLKALSEWAVHEKPVRVNYSLKRAERYYRWSRRYGLAIYALTEKKQKENQKTPCRLKLPSGWRQIMDGSGMKAMGKVFKNCLAGKDVTNGFYLFSNKLIVQVDKNLNLVEAKRTANIQPGQRDHIELKSLLNSLTELNRSASFK